MKTKNRILALALTVTAGLTSFAGNAKAQTSGFGGDGAGWTLNNSLGTAPTINSDVLTIVDGFGAANSAFYNIPQGIQSFTASFVWQNTVRYGPGDGMVFTLQNQKLTAVGDGGGGLGFNGITPAGGIAFNLWNNHTLGLSGTPVTGSYLSTAPVDFDSTDPISVSINYTTSNLSVTVTDVTTAASYSTNFNVDLEAVAGGSTAYVGFTGASGAAQSHQTISNFQFNAVPEPSTYALFGFGGVALIVTYRRCRSS